MDRESNCLGELLRFLISAILLFFLYQDAFAQGNISFKIAQIKHSTKQVMVERTTLDLPIGYTVRLEKESCSGVLTKKNNKYFLFTFNVCSDFAKVVSTGFLTILYAQENAKPKVRGNDEDSKFLNYQVSDFIENQHLILVERINGDLISEDDLFNLFSPSKQFCVLEVTNVFDTSFYLNTEGCKFEFEIRKGLKLEPKSLRKQAKGKSEKLTQARQKKNPKKSQQIKLAPYYVHFGLGYGRPTYNSGADKATVDSLVSNDAVSRLSLHFDLLGLYFPVEDWRMLLGGNLGLSRDGFSGQGISFEFYHFFMGVSSIYYPFDELNLNGLFLRADLGFARQISTVIKSSETGTADNGSQKSGVGLRLGIGWGIEIQPKTILLPQVYYSILSLSDSKINTMVVQLGLLF